MNKQGSPSQSPERWPSLPLAEWQDTLDTLHMWLQIVGKIKLELTPYRNQWWHIGLHPTPRGLTTGLIPYGDESFEIDFNFIDHNVTITTSDGASRQLALRAQTVADFYKELMTTLESLGIAVEINTIPVEVPHTIPCHTNEIHKDYDPEYVTRWWRINLETSKVMQRFNVTFTGKSSPPLFFWGSFDLGLTRFSGRPADPPAGAPRFVRLAENEENAACGFWPGNTSMAGITYGEPAFYAYIYPYPDGYAESPVRPDAAYYDEQMGEFILRYADVIQSDDPEQAILDFFESTYQAAATCAAWDRASLEFDPTSVT